MAKSKQDKKLYSRLRGSGVRKKVARQLTAHDALGSPLRWRLLAEHNRITDPLTVPAGTALAVPPVGAATVPPDAVTTGGTP